MTLDGTQASKVAALRALHARPGGFMIPNAWDAGGARLLAKLGFEAIATTSAALAWSLGRQDGGSGGEAALANGRAIAAAVSIPVTADLENGFGCGLDDVADTVRSAAEAGLAGFSIEDASGDQADPIQPFPQALERVRAAVAANQALPVPLVLTARAENFLHGRPDLDDTIRRLQAFAAAGADVLYAPGLPDLAAIRRVCRAVPGPVNVLAGGTPPWPAAEIFAAGAQRVSVGSALARIAWSGFLEAAAAMREKGDFTWTARRPSFAELERLLAPSFPPDA